MNNLKLAISIFLLFLSILPIQAQYDGDQLFDETVLHEINITASISIDELTLIYYDNFLNEDGIPYTISEVEIDGIFLDSIGVRIKGGITAFDEKKPFKLDFNEFVSGRRYDGLKKLNMHQGGMDPSFLRETMSYGILRFAGVKTARTSFAKVYFNGMYQGVYTLVEQIDDDFIQNRFASNQGTLYKTGINGLEIKYEIDNSLPYEDFKDAIMQIPDNQLHEQLPNYVDVESFLRFFAIQIFINAVDGPLSVDENYYIYYEPKSATYVYIPWDYNLALYQGVNYPLFPNSANFIFNRIMENTVLTEQYLDIFCQLLDYNFDVDRLHNKIDNYVALLDGEVQNDPFIDLIGDWNMGVMSIRNAISNRFQALSDEIDTNFGGCDPLVTPIEISDIVINEVVASNDSTSGITDPAGGSADWIELYNNTSTDLSLQRFYLSNDIDVLKHWRFPENTIIPANDYLIIWADRDIHENELHTDFKLNKDKGDVFLSFENGDIIDQVSFTDQINQYRVSEGSEWYRRFHATTKHF